MQVSIKTFTIWLMKLSFACTGTSVVTVVATDADDPTYGNSARLSYSILQGQPYFSVEPKTGEAHLDTPQHNTWTHDCNSNT